MNRRLLLFMCLLPMLAAAQSPSREVLHQRFAWLRYYNKLTVSPQWQVQTELEMRRYVSPDRLHQSVLRVNVLHQNGSLRPSMGGGATYFLQALPQLAGEELDHVRPEIRAHQEITLHQEGTVRLSHRYKVEERFFLKSTEEEQLDFNLRLRYKVEAQFPLTESASGAGAVLLRVYDELMVNAGKKIVNNVFDQNRVYASVQLGLSDHWAAEVAYLYWFQQRPTGFEFYSRHIGRITLTHTLTLIKS